MCGIAGVYFKQGNKDKIASAVQWMNEIQSRRGPDGEGIWAGEGIVLGHRRLSIIDLSSLGAQPMSDERGELHISFNGEIYNFLELRDELSKKGHRFRSKTDTEVILTAYKEWGANSFVKLRGMFAFALWDKEKNELYLARDHYGIKPLYYYAKNGVVAFASTVKALEGSGLVPTEKNLDATVGFLLFGSVPQPLTTLKDVVALPAGSYLKVRSDGNMKLVPYYDMLDPFKKKSSDDFGAAVEKVRALLQDSVSHHLISDAPLGVFLSGGLDSSALAALAAGNREKPIATLSVVFHEAEFSEKNYQQMVSERIKSDHHEILVAENDYFDILPEIFEAMDQPTIDGANTFFVSWAAKRAGLKVVLSGLGSDELFMGYASFKSAPYLRALRSMPGLAPYLFSLLRGKYGKLSHLSHKDPLHFYLSYRGLRTMREVRELSGMSERGVAQSVERMVAARNLPGEIFDLDAEDLLSYLELQVYLQNQLLKDTDFMSMHHSIEVRVPFLDKPLVEYMASLPPKIKMHGKEIKPLLVGAMRDMLPDEIFTRKKMGFTFPFEKWLKNAPPEMTNGLLTNDQMIKFKSGKVHWSQLWSLMVARKFNLL